MQIYSIPTIPSETIEIPIGYCQCGCGGRTPIAERNRRAIGHVKGEPVRFIPGHNGRNWSKDRPAPLVIPESGIALIPVFGESIGASEYVFAMVDISDLHIVAPYRWIVYAADRTVYAKTRMDRSEPERWMHRVIMGVGKGSPLVDHANFNGLDNRRRNLRIATHSQNHANAPKVNRVGGTTSPFKGVSYHAQAGKWMAAIQVDKKRYYLGLYATQEDAARAYDDAARMHFGEFAWVNFTDEGGLR